jgi:hypothetical protein
MGLGSHVSPIAARKVRKVNQIRLRQDRKWWSLQYRLHGFEPKCNRRAAVIRFWIQLFLPCATAWETIASPHKRLTSKAGCSDRYSEFQPSPSAKKIRRFIDTPCIVLTFSCRIQIASGRKCRLGYGTSLNSSATYLRNESCIKPSFSRRSWRGRPSQRS